MSDKAQAALFMKIGILTFHRAHNYGAVLQCYALQETLKGMGHDVEVIDYRQKWTEEVYKPFSLLVMRIRYRSIKSMIKYFLTFPGRLYKSKKAKAHYESFRAKFLSISNKYEYNKELYYDVCIVGSDQLWGMSCLGGQLDDVYLGYFKVQSGCKKVAYAISSNTMSIDYLAHHSKLLPSLQNFSKLSFRESSVIERINKYSGFKYTQCIDPTLLADREVWDPMISDIWAKKKYVACYRARGNGNSGFSLEQTAYTLAAEHGWDVIDLSSQTMRVEDFISIIAHAQYIVTTSFHATVFSLIFNRPLATYLLHDGHDSRYEDLLKKIDCAMFLHEVTASPRIYTDIDWPQIMKNLEKLKSDSIHYLKEALK